MDSSCKAQKPESARAQRGVLQSWTECLQGIQQRLKQGELGVAQLPQGCLNASCMTNTDIWTSGGAGVQHL